MRRRLTILLALAALLPVTACGGEEATVTVLAAASLTEPFEELADLFEADHPGVEVRLAFDSSATLAQQAVEGAPADVLATADAITMDGAAEALAGEPRAFATNRMVLVTPASDPARIGGFRDLATGRADYVACVETAPCGRAARELLELNAITADPASLEVDVKAVLAKVTSGEADAGIVYASDAIAAGESVRTIEIPGAGEALATYLVAPLQQAEDDALAREFVELVLTDRSQQLLDDAGFGTKAGP